MPSVVLVQLSVGVPVGVTVSDAADSGDCESAGGIDGEAESVDVCVGELDSEALSVVGELALCVSEPVSEGVCDCVCGGVSEPVSEGVCERVCEGVCGGVSEPVSEGVCEGVCEGVAVIDGVTVALAVPVALALALRHDTRITQKVSEMKMSPQGATATPRGCVKAASSAGPVSESPTKGVPARSVKLLPPPGSATRTT